MLDAPPAIELRHLRYFLAVVEELHFRRAAERLHIAQPPLSQAIRRLEDALGVQLLQRTSRAVSATAAGLVFAAEAQKVLAAVEEAVAEARRAGGATIPLRIGSLPEGPIERVQRLVQMLEERLRVPTFVIHLVATEQVRRLRSGELEFGMLHDAGSYGDIDLVPLFAGEPLVGVLGPDHQLAGREVLHPADLEQELLVMAPRSADPHLYDSLLARAEEAGYRFRAVAEAAGPNERDLVLMVAVSGGIALRLHWDADRGERAVVSRALEPALTMPDTMLASPAEPPPRVRRVLASVRSVAASIHAQRPLASRGSR